MPERLKALCPEGIDVYFDNVGGDTLSAVLPLCNNFARIPTCGLITHYDNLHEPMKGPENYQYVLMRRITIQGFIMFDPSFIPKMAVRRDPLPRHLRLLCPYPTPWTSRARGAGGGGPHGAARGVCARGCG